MNRPGRYFLCDAGLVCVFIGVAGPGKAGDLPGNGLSRIGTIHAFAHSLAASQHADGRYELGKGVQAHLKAEIAMALASEATGDPAYGWSALASLQWIVAEHLEDDGGLNWTGTNDPYFFECHQHWFLIATALAERATGKRGLFRDLQRLAWRFLLETNPSGRDFYGGNADSLGAFFAYRSVDRKGRFQTQASFKGAYEVGTALWSLSLHRSSRWLRLRVGSFRTPKAVLERFGAAVLEVRT